MTLSISYTGFLSSRGFLVFEIPLQNSWLQFCRNRLGKESVLFWILQSSYVWEVKIFISVTTDVYHLLHLNITGRYKWYKSLVLAYVYFSKWHFWYQWLTALDQKPHKSAAFSPDRMCSGFLLKVAVKPYPLILMFHFYICVPWDDCVSLFSPFYDHTFNCKTGFPYQRGGPCHIHGSDLISMQNAPLNASGFFLLDFSLSDWDSWLYNWMWGRSETQSTADGGEVICVKSALFHEGQRYTYRKDSTSGLQAEWVVVLAAYEYCIQLKMGFHALLFLFQLIFGWSTKPLRNWVVMIQ